MIGRLVIVLRNGGGPTLKPLWCVLNACYSLSVRFKLFSSSIHLFPRISPNLKNAKSFFWSKCLSEVRPVYAFSLATTDTLHSS